MVVFIVTALKLEVPDVTDIDWELSAGHVEDGAAPVLTEPVRVHRGGHDDHSQRPLAAPGPALDCRLQDITQSERSQTDPLSTDLHNSKEDVGVDGPLVGLVQHDPAVAGELVVQHRLSEQHPVGLVE